jgi:VWFA-related protein
MRRIVAVIRILLVPVLILGSIAAAHPQGNGTRTIYVSVTEKSGTPVTDLTAADFELKIGGKAQPVTAAQLTKVPLRMALIVADGGTGAVQYPAATFVQRLQEVGEFAIVAVVEQPDRIVNFTSDMEALAAGFKRLGPRTNKPSRGQLMEALSETVKDVAQPGKRSVIVVLTVGGAASSSLRSDVVRDDLRKSGTTLYVIEPPGSGTGASDLDVVLNDGSRESGGRIEQVAGPNLVKAAEQISQELLNQYEVSFAGEGLKAGDRVELSSKRKNVKVNAPTRLAS